MPIASTRKRKNVANPPTTSRLEKEEPGTEFAPAAPAIARMRASIERCPNNFGSRLANSGSRTINKVPATVRMISGEKRSRSSLPGAKLLGDKLASMYVASGHVRQRHAQGSIPFTLVEDLRIRFRHRGQECLCIHAHP